MGMRMDRAGAYAFTVRLEDPNELFEPRAADVERGRSPEVPAIDQIRTTFGAHRYSDPGTVTIELPPDKATPEVERGLRQAYAHYCKLGTARSESELAAIRRDGWRTLLSGAIVLFIGLALSEAVLRTRGIPKELRDFLGNGLFLVVAWVGLWYPLDTLFYSGRPPRGERRLLRAMCQIELVVRPIGERLQAADPPETAAVAGQSLTGG